ncbi:mechanosensitive ion channel family protein [Alloscardovia venturai]|uniref:Mechanosensitive ion channel family protein n=1 Tax=Alloscardovia venturai TaxID=1769421 RepID=A0ABW2Y4X5_9BIFI
MTEIFSSLTSWINSRVDRIVFLLIAFVITWLLSHFVAKLMHTILDRAPIPSASLFINVIRVLIWVIGIVIVLKPVFGIEATSLVTALGIGGLAVSLGLQDTISNFLGGFGLMASKVIKPGDRITINGITGRVQDVTWRHTVLVERSGSHLVIPNSVLNTSALERLPRANEAFTTLHILLRSDIDVKSTFEDIVTTVSYSTRNLALKGTTPTVRLTNFSAYGIDAEVILYAKDGIAYAAIHDAAARALAGKPYMAQMHYEADSSKNFAHTAVTSPLSHLHDDLATPPDLVETKILSPTPLKENSSSHRHDNLA